MLLEKIYVLCFWLVCFFKKLIGSKSFENIKIISVGNLAVGGTGKSVVVQFLIQNLRNFNGAIVSRGYGRKKSYDSKNLIVCDGDKILTDVEHAGDEPYMLALRLKVPVCVGANRKKSIELLQNLPSKKIDFVVLDDAYQNFQLKKDFEILLLDTNNPFGNGHCLPSGLLREKDYSRADLILLTHCKRVSDNHIEFVKQKLLKNFDSNKIFSTYHRPTQLRLLNEKKIKIKKLTKQKFLLFAGIGRFDLFVETVKNLNLKVCENVEYADHRSYCLADVNYILQKFNEVHGDGIITTAKDWHKILPIIRQLKDWEKIPIYVLDVELEFVKEEEKINFLKLVSNILKK